MAEEKVASFLGTKLPIIYNIDVSIYSIFQTPAEDC